jgi:hypothetical protein
VTTPRGPGFINELDSGQAGGRGGGGRGRWVVRIN